MKTPIVTELDWDHYEMCRDLPVNFRFVIDMPSVTTLPKALTDRLYRKWWAQTYFDQLVGQSIRTFINQKLNKNSAEVRRKTARRGKIPNASDSGHEQQRTGAMQEPTG